MQIVVADALKDTEAGREAGRIIRSCVHCGFCTAVCPTYQLLGDDLDSPRGRIYLIKSLIEGRPAGAATQKHLDRCLLCRACETACPSEVEYGKLLTIGRELLAQRTARSVGARVTRLALKNILPYKRRFALLLGLARFVRPLLPRSVRARVPVRGPQNNKVAPGSADHDRRAILFSGCVQDALAAGINRSARRVLDAVGWAATSVPGEGCCGAIHYHIGDHRRAIELMCRNIDRWQRYIDQGVETLVFTASGCGLMIKEYGEVLKDIPEYAQRAERVASMARDISEMFDKRAVARLGAELNKPAFKVAYQCPCTLQHGLRLPGVTEELLVELGIDLVEGDPSGACCGSAGTYSLLEPALSSRLQRDKIDALMAPQPDLIATSNIGCLHHLQQLSPVPVRHWIEVVDGLLPDEPAAGA